MRLNITIISAIILTGCASVDVVPPKAVDVERTRVYDIDFHTTWVKAVDWFADHNVIIDKIEKESGLLTAKRLIEVEGEKYLDCGQINVSGAMSQDIDMLGSLNVTVRIISDQKTKVNVNFFGEYRVKGRDAWDGRSFETDGVCVSTGSVEKSILNYISN